MSEEELRAKIQAAAEKALLARKLKKLMALEQEVYKKTCPTNLPLQTNDEPALSLKQCQQLSNLYTHIRTIQDLLVTQTKSLSGQQQEWIEIGMSTVKIVSILRDVECESELESYLQHNGLTQSIFLDTLGKIVLNGQMIAQETLVNANQQLRRFLPVYAVDSIMNLYLTLLTNPQAISAQLMKLSEEGLSEAYVDWLGESYLHLHQTVSLPSSVQCLLSYFFGLQLLVALANSKNVSMSVINKMVLISIGDEQLVRGSQYSFDEKMLRIFEAVDVKFNTLLSQNYKIFSLPTDNHYILCLLAQNWALNFQKWVYQASNKERQIADNSEEGFRRKVMSAYILDKYTLFISSPKSLMHRLSFIPSNRCNIKINPLTL